MKSHAFRSSLIAVAATGALSLGASSFAQDAPGSVPVDQLYPGQLTVNVDLGDPARRVFRVHETIPVKSGPFTLLYPEWIPGGHAPSGPIRNVAGLTITEAQRAVEAAYRDGRFLRSPQVSISVEDYALREVSIQGQVKAPGRYVLPVETTFSVLELVTKAGGFTDIAKGSAVVVTRIGPDGQKVTFTVDVDGVIRGRKSSKSSDNLLLEPGDIVYVPERII